MVKKKEYKFVKQAQASSDLKTVSARVPKNVYEAFQTAAKVAEENGLELSITNVVVAAMAEAIAEVKEAVGEDKFQGDLLK